MRCNNCGASVARMWCDYCRSYVGGTEEKLDNLKDTEARVEKILAKIKYIETSPAPSPVKEKKILLLRKELEEIDFPN